MNSLRLGVNIDHVATLRNARGGVHPCPVRAAQLAAWSGADGITAHLREDRRHIHDVDIARLREECDLPLNFEMAVTEEMIAIALKTRPHACCLVPESREELTTEGGLDVRTHQTHIASATARLKDAGIRVSLFVDADLAQLEAAAACGADIVEIHTGAYCDAKGSQREKELQRIVEAAAATAELGLECHGGHGLTFGTVEPIAEIPQMRELNIGHFLVGEAIFMGFEAAIRRMRELMDGAR